MSIKDKPSALQVNKPTSPKPNPSTNHTKVTQYESSHSNRLGGLIYNPNLIPEHKQMIQGKMSAVNFTRKCIEYVGCGIFLLHMIKNRLRISKSTGLYIAVPPTLSYIVKLMGYWWVDNYAERSGMYKVYRISTF